MNARNQLAQERESWLAVHPVPLSETAETEYHRLFSDRIDDWLDAGIGSCILKNPDLSQIVFDALLHFDGFRVFMDAIVIMPTHVHALFQLEPDHKLEDVVHSWKSYTASRLNAALHRTAPLWMKDYWDRMIRSPDHYRKVREHILTNPVKAHLIEGQYRIWQREPSLLTDRTE